MQILILLLSANVNNLLMRITISVQLPAVITSNVMYYSILHEKISYHWTFQVLGIMHLGITKQEA